MFSKIPYSAKQLSVGLSLVLSIITSSTYAHPNDPLSSSEMAKALSLTQSVSNSVPGNVAARAATQGRKELLLIERHEDKNAPKGQRLADIFTYDYATDELIESRVNLTSNEVVSSKRKKNVQLPLTENEVNRAKQIVFEDENERRILENEYQRITGRSFSTTDELNIKAFTFTRDSLPNRVNEASKLCGLQRCAQMMLYTGENIVFEVSPIVNLSKGVVTQRIGF
jgi:Cu2+-containing amine oxidase